jgi:molybdopterin synthase sulfur carrier subunit
VGADEPQIKASYFAGNLAAIGVSGSRAEEVRARTAHIHDAFGKLSRVDWAPLAWDLELTDVAVDVGGLAAVRALNRHSMLQSVEGPRIRPLISAGVNVFGLNPGTFVRYLPRAWAAATRGLGVIEVTLGTDRADLVFHGLPAAALAHGPWLDGFCGIIEGVNAATGFCGGGAAASAGGRARALRRRVADPLTAAWGRTLGGTFTSTPLSGAAPRGRPSTMITVRYFAAARDVVDVDREDVDVDGVTVAALRALLLARHPGLARVLPQSRLAVNQRFAREDVVVDAGAEVAVIPPVGGG